MGIASTSRSSVKGWSGSFQPRGVSHWSHRCSLDSAAIFTAKARKRTSRESRRAPTASSASWEATSATAENAQPTKKIATPRHTDPVTETSENSGACTARTKPHPAPATAEKAVPIAAWTADTVARLTPVPSTSSRRPSSSPRRPAVVTMSRAATAVRTMMIIPDSHWIAWPMVPGWGIVPNSSRVAPLEFIISMTDRRNSMLPRFFW